jgi:hypothetical protein
MYKLSIAEYLIVCQVSIYIIFNTRDHFQNRTPIPLNDFFKVPHNCQVINPQFNGWN